MSDESLLITLGVQDKGANKQINALNKELRFLDKEYKATSKGSKDFGKTQDELKTKISYLDKKYEATNQKLQVYKKRMTETKTAIKQKEDELEKLTSAENVNEKAVEKVSKQLENMKTSLRNAEQGISLTEIELNNLTDELIEANTELKNSAVNAYKAEMQQLGDELDKTGDKLQKYGEGMSNIGGKMMMLSAPLVAFAGYSAKVAMEFEAAMSNVEAISGATGDELERLSDKAKEMGANTSKSAKDAADAMSYMALAGWNSTQIMNGIEPVLRLAEAGNLDLARASDLTTDSLSAMGLQVDDLNKYLDVCAQTQRKANTTADAMMEAYISCGGTLKNLKVPLEESATYIGILANRGKKGSEAGNALNSVLINLTSGAGQAGVAMKKLGLSAFDSKGNFKGMNTVLQELGGKLAKCTEEQRNTYLAMIGGKTQVDTLNALLSGTSEEFTKLNRDIKNSKGALDEMAKTMQNNAQGNVTKLKSQLEGLGIQIGTHLLPHINTLIGHLSKLIEWFGNLDEGTQKLIINTGLLTFATGGALKVFGSLTSGAGSLVKMLGRVATSQATTATTTTALNAATTTTATGGVKKLIGSLTKLNPVAVAVGGGLVVAGTAVAAMKKHSELLGNTVLDTSDDMSTFEKSVAAMTGINVKSKDELIKLGLVYNDFSSNISQEFQEAVKQSQTSLIDFTATMKEISFDNVLTKEENKTFTDRVKETAKTAKTIVEDNAKKGKEAFTEMFMADDGKVDKSEKRVIEIMQKSSETQKTEIDTLEKEILKIKDTALKKKRGLNDQEIKDIEFKLSRIKEIELEALGASQEEILYAKNEFASRIATMDLESASKLMEEKALKRDEEIAKIRASYDTQIQLMEEKLPELNEKDRVAMEEQINKHKETRDKKIGSEIELYDSLLGIVKEKNPFILDEINEHNGKILTAEDKKSRELYNNMRMSYDDLNKITKDGTYKMYNKFTSSWDNITVNVDENTGKIIGLYSEMQGKGAGYSSDMAKDMSKLGKEYEAAQKVMGKALKDSEKITIDASGNMIDANGKIVGSIEDIKTEADGTRTGILDLNGTPVSVKVNKDGTLRDLDSIRIKLDNLSKPRTISVTTNHHINQTQSVQKSIPSPGNIDSQNFLLRAPTIPETYENMDLNNGLYRSDSVESVGLVNTARNSTAIIQNNSIDYNKLADIFASTLLEAMKNIELKANVNSILDSSVIGKSVDKVQGTLSNISNRRLGK